MYDVRSFGAPATRNGQGSSNSSSSVVWNKSRILEHLTMEQCGWSFGTSSVFSSILNNVSSSFDRHGFSAELLTRLGDGYELFPKMRNVPIAVAIDVTHAAGAPEDKSKRGDELRAQVTNVKVATESAECCLGIALNPSKQQLLQQYNIFQDDNEDDEDDDIGGDVWDIQDIDSDTSDHGNDKKPSKGKASSSANALGAAAITGIVGGVTGGIGDAANLVSFGWFSSSSSLTPAAPAPAPAAAKNNSSWGVSTPKQLEQRIRELEAQNKQLVAENQRLRGKK
jgi:hypothetical protein